MSPLTSVLLGLRLDGDSIPLWNRLEYSSRKKVINVSLNLVTVLAVIAVLAPLFWMLNTAIRPEGSVTTLDATILPTEVTTENFEKVIVGSNFLIWFKNSVLVAAGVVILTTATATLGGYGLTRIDIPYKKTTVRMILFGYMFPPILLSIPMFIFWRQLGWINSQVGLIFAETAIALPFSLWLMWKFFQTVPLSLEESARMCGATRFRAFYEVALPLAKPGMVAVAVFSFAVSWNQYTMPEVLMVSNENWVITLGLYNFTVQNTIRWPQLMAASFMAIVPGFLLVYFLQKYLLRGFRVGGIG